MPKLELIGKGDAAVVIRENGDMSFHVSVNGDEHGPFDQEGPGTFAQEAAALFAWAANDPQTIERFQEVLEETHWSSILSKYATITSTDKDPWTKKNRE